MKLEEIALLIEGEPSIGSIPIEPGLMNQKKGTQKIVGFNSESEEINEGLIRFDIVFYVKSKNGLTKMIVNVEAQRKDSSNYAILNRAIFYVSRLLSSQKERDFERSNYNDLKRVYSIWIVMNMKENNLTHVKLTEQTLLGTHPRTGDLNLFHIVLIGLSKQLTSKEENHSLHRLLGTLLSDTLKAEAIRIEQGIKQGVRKMILSMQKNGFSCEEIAKIADMTEEEIKQIEASSFVL